MPFPNGLAGGFLGVDVFFVISGYLITRVIVGDIEKGHFSYWNFYLRRFRRLFPALSLMLMAVVLCGWIFLTEAEYQALAKHTISGIFFSANLIYWHESGYFDVAAHTKPLLNLWSLGIEEQFYLIWPSILILSLAKKRLFQVTAGFLLLSFLACLYVTKVDNVSAFYFPVTRFCELLCGSLLAQWHDNKLTRQHRHILSVAGLAFCVGSFVLIADLAAIPGYLTALPVLGAMMLIASGRESIVNAYVLASRPMVLVGLISYPLYLWHWPMLVFARILNGDLPSIPVRLGVVFCSFVLSILTYLYFERPVRQFPTARATNRVLKLTVVTLSVAILIFAFQGFPDRGLTLLTSDAKTASVGTDRNKSIRECGVYHESLSLKYCLKSRKDHIHYAVMGDSKADALYYGLAREQTDSGWVLVGNVQPPIANPSDDDQTKNLIAFQAILNNPDIHAVVWAIAIHQIFPTNAITGYVEGDTARAWNRQKDFIRAFQKLVQARKQVIFIIDNPTLPAPLSCVSGEFDAPNVINSMFRRRQNPRCTIRYSEHLHGTKEYRQFVAELKKSVPELTVIDLADFLCDIPRDVCSIAQGKNYLYSYSDHISDYANSMIAKKYILPELDQKGRQ